MTCTTRWRTSGGGRRTRGTSHTDILVIETDTCAVQIKVRDKALDDAALRRLAEGMTIGDCTARDGWQTIN